MFVAAIGGSVGNSTLFCEMTHVSYRLTCDNCNKREFSEGDESVDDLEINAQCQGWTFRVVPNGSIWDLCPKCSELKIEELN